MGNLWLGRYFGINTYIHWTFWLLPVFIIMTNQGPGVMLQLALAFATFACVVLHEYGHALAALFRHRHA